MKIPVSNIFFFQGLFITATALALLSLGVFAWFCLTDEKNLYITSLILAALSFTFGLTTIIIMRVNLYDPYCGGVVQGTSIVNEESEDSIGIHLAAAGTAAAGAFALFSFVLYKNDAFVFKSHAIQKQATHNVGSLLF